MHDIYKAKYLVSHSRRIILFIAIYKLSSIPSHFIARVRNLIMKYYLQYISSAVPGKSWLSRVLSLFIYRRETIRFTVRIRRHTQNIFIVSCSRNIIGFNDFIFIHERSPDELPEHEDTGQSCFLSLVPEKQLFLLNSSSFTNCFQTLSKPLRE